MAAGVRSLFPAAKEELIPTLSKFGFRRHRTTNSFVRRFGDIYHFVSLSGSRWGGRFYVYVTAWVPEMENTSGKPAEMFKKGMNTIRLGGRLSPRMVGEGTWSWEFGTETQNKESLADVTRHLERVAIPWFAAMSDRAQIVRALSRKLSDDEKSRILNPEQPAMDFDIPDTAEEYPYPWAPGELQPICENSFFDESDDELFLELGGDNLAAAMSKRGFELQRAPVFRFKRKDNKYTWVITLEPASNGVHVITRICTFSKLAAKHVYGTVNAELMDAHYWQVNGGWLCVDGIQKVGQGWLVAGKPQIKEMTSKFLESVDEYAMPWFESVSTDKGFLESLNPDYIPSERYASLQSALKKGISEVD